MDKFRLKIRTLLLYAVTLCLGVFAAKILWTILEKVTLIEKPIPLEEPLQISKEEIPQIEPKIESLAPTIETKRELKEKLVLNGVFFSEGQKYALINNQIVKVGDSIIGAKVKRITLEEVELEFEGSIIKLSLTYR